MKKAKKNTEKAAGYKRLTRKDHRKLKRLEKKEKKSDYFKKKKLSDGATGKDVERTVGQQSVARNAKKKIKRTEVSPSRIPVEQLLSGSVPSDNDESIDSDFSDEEIDALIPDSLKSKPAEPLAKKPKKQIGTQRIDPAEARKREIKKQQEFEAKARKVRVKQLRAENEDEDRTIAKLEKQLKLNKSKEKKRLINKLIAGDDMEDLCNVLVGVEEFINSTKKKSGGTEKRKPNYDEDMDEDGDDYASEDDEFVDDDGSLGASDSDDNAEEVKKSSEPEYKEDIYGRKRDKDGNIVTETPASADQLQQPLQKYVPPHQRALLAAPNDDSNAQQREALAQLQRRCKGLLNRLSEANLHKIAANVEELYMRNSRYNMNDALAAQVVEDLIGVSLTGERMVQEHMVLLAYLHAHVGSEIGAHFLQLFIGRFDELVKSVQSLEISDKRLNNLVLVLSYMYIFKIYEHRLLLEIIAHLASNLCEKSVECLLVVFHAVGFKLRRDDPIAFKEMMLDIQQKVAKAPLEIKENIRLKFMVDTLMAVKNNNTHKLSQYDPELVEDLLKRLKVMLRNGCSVVTLNITLADLLSADKGGKWWIVGSAWSGNVNEMGGAARPGNQKAGQAERFSEKLLALAKKQQMNTNERRNIFCIIMSAEDCTDAFEKLLQLNLKGQRDIAYVIIHCCINQKKPNPYFSHLAIQFCQHHRDNKHAFKRASQDRIGDIESLSKLQVRNFAHFLRHLIATGNMQLDVLEDVDVLEFVKVQKLPAACYLAKEILFGLLLDDDKLAAGNAFEYLAKFAKKPKIKILKRDIGVFISQFLLNEANTKLDVEKYALLKKRVGSISKYICIDGLVDFLK